MRWILLFASIGFLGAEPAHAAPSATIEVSGASTYFAEPGEIITVELRLADDTVGLQSAFLVIEYDSDALSVSSATTCPFGNPTCHDFAPSSSGDLWSTGLAPIINEVGPGSSVSQIVFGPTGGTVDGPPDEVRLAELQVTVAASGTMSLFYEPGIFVMDRALTGHAPPATLSVIVAGSVASEQKISDTQGGLLAVLDDEDQIGHAAAGIGDLDRDGVLDVAIGAPLDDDGAVNAGAIYILFLNADGTVKAEQKISATAGGFTGSLDSDDRFGAELAMLRDLDGDGVQELVASASKDDDGGSNTGAAYVLFMNTDGTVKAHQKISNLSGGLGAVNNAEDEFGSGPTAIGDLDGDGIPDLAVGSYLDNASGGNSGSLYILFLETDGTVRASQKITEDVGGFDGTLDVSDRFGTSLANLGDLDGDGTLELAVGARFDGISDAGVVYLLSLNADGTVASHVLVEGGLNGFVGPTESLDRFSRPARIGDLDGDGVGDLAVGAYTDDDGQAEAGAVWVLFLNADGTVKGERKISATAGNFGGALDTGDLFGVGLTSVGDLNGDGVSDLVVGAVQDDDGGTDRGAAYVLFMDGAPAICGNSVLDPLEECDDGNASWGDGCSATCEVEDDVALYGVASTGGLLDVTVDGVVVSLAVAVSDSPAALAVLLAAAINADSSLLALGTSAQALGNRVVTTGRVSSASSTAADVYVQVEPGRILAETKISDTAGGFLGVLSDSDEFGEAVAQLGDVDGDGVDDLAVIARGDMDGGGPHGALWILFLNPDGTVKAEQKISATAGGFVGPLDEVERFSSVTALGDLDKDGTTDVAVGAPNGAFIGDDGSVWILFLNSNGTVKAEHEIESPPKVPSQFFSGIFGASVAALGDLNGDGIVDLAVGHHGNDPDHNGVRLYFLDADGTVKAEALIPTHEIIQGFGESSFGRSLAPVSDLDGDGRIELAVGAPDMDGGGVDRGVVRIYFLNADGTVATFNEIRGNKDGFTQPLVDNGSFGSAIGSPGDLDADGHGDLVVRNSETLWLLFLQADGTVREFRRMEEGTAGILGGLARVGDLDAAGAGEFASGDPTDDDGGTDRGAVWLLTLDEPWAFCSDGILVSPEECDDGNAISGDGCFSDCMTEEGELFLFGVAEGGTVSVTIEGVKIVTDTTAGQTAQQVLSALEAIANANLDLQIRGVRAELIGSRLVTTGVIDRVRVSDPGLEDPTAVPALSMGGLVVLAIAMTLLTGWQIRRRTSLAP